MIEGGAIRCLHRNWEGVIDMHQAGKRSSSTGSRNTMMNAYEVQIVTGLRACKQFRVLRLEYSECRANAMVGDKV
jgi:hypothetical protein